MQTKTVIVIHGLWMTGFEMGWLRGKLRQAGYKPLRFSYRMLSRSLDFNIEKLRDMICAQPDQVHLVGHSLGGVLALQTLRKYPDLNVARVVCMGSPLVDTHAGRNLASFGFGRFMLGKTLPDAVFAEPLKAWSGKQQVGSIAGSFGVGMGRLIAKLEKPHDGMVSAIETQLPGIADYLVLPVNHTGMLISDRVADQTHFFFRFGHFDRQHSKVHAGAQSDRGDLPHYDR
jgi:pimeloyl-ACP methyl ester carboxylesterase